MQSLRIAMIMCVSLSCIAFSVKAQSAEGATTDPDKPTTSASPATTDDAEPEKSLGNVNLTAKSINDAGLKLKNPESKNMIMTVELPGEITVNAERVAHLSPKVAGTTIEVLKGVGDVVKEGEPLAVLESTELGTAKIEYFTAVASHDLAQRDVEREKGIHDNSARMIELLKSEPEPTEIEKKLKGVAIGENKTKLLKAYSELRMARSAGARAEKLQVDKLISNADSETARKNQESAEVEFSGTLEEIQFSTDQRLYQAERAVRLAQSTLKNAQRRLYLLGLSDTDVEKLSEEKSSQISRFTLRAPFAGTIVERSMGTGEQHEPNGHAFTVADLSTVWLTLSVYPKNIIQVKPGQKVTIKVHGQEKVRTGNITAVNPFVDERTRAATARVILDNADGTLRPGMFVTAEVVVEEVSVIAVPLGAIQTIDNKKVVFVKGCKPTEFKTQPVTLGRINRTLAEIKVGLIEDDWVIVAGNTFLLKAEFGKGKAVG